MNIQEPEAEALDEDPNSLASRINLIAMAAKKRNPHGMLQRKLFTDEPPSPLGPNPYRLPSLGVDFSLPESEDQESESKEVKEDEIYSSTPSSPELKHTSAIFTPQYYYHSPPAFHTEQVADSIDPEAVYMNASSGQKITLYATTVNLSNDLQLQDL